MLESQKILHTLKASSSLDACIRNSQYRTSALSLLRHNCTERKETLESFALLMNEKFVWDVYFCLLASKTAAFTTIERMRMLV